MHSKVRSLSTTLGTTCHTQLPVTSLALVCFSLAIYIYATPFLWTAACQDAFAGMKTALTTAPCLALPDTSENATIFELVCDASGFGLGAVLIQEGRPIAFWSRKVVPAERNYHVTEQELLAVIDALKAFRCYVDGVPVILVTDHKPHTFVTTQPTLFRRQTCWSEYLQGSCRLHMGIQTW